MTIDPEIATLLDRVRRAGRPPFESMSPAEARLSYRKAARVLEIASRPLPRVTDHAFRSRDGADVRVRLYAATLDEPLPALLYFHGGGFTIGSVDTHDSVCRMFAHDAQCLVLSVDYRLAPEHRFPIAVNDAHDALRWAVTNAEALGLDRARLAIGGDSAGATLATVTAIHARDDGIDCALQMLIYPGTRHDDDTASRRALATGYLLDATTIDWFFDGYAPAAAQRSDWRFAPLDGLRPDGRPIDLAGIAPACVVTAGYDPLHDEGVAYVQRLRAAGVPVEHLEYSGMIHGFLQFAGAIATARQAHRDLVAVLAKALSIRLPSASSAAS